MDVLSERPEGGVPGGPPERPRQRLGRPPLTSRSDLLAAAPEIGFPGLTVGAVTSHCGVKYSTFYRHFPNVETLVSDTVDAVLADVRFAEPGRPWRAHLEELALSLARLLVDNPDLAQAIATLPRRPARLVGATGDATDRRLAAGFGADDAELGVTTAVETVLALGIGGFARTESGGRPRGADTAGAWSVARAAPVVRPVRDGLAARLPAG